MPGPVPPDPTAPDLSGVDGVGGVGGVDGVVGDADVDTDLASALERVDADLAALRDAPAPPIPADVAARLDATLAAARPVRKTSQRVGSWIVAVAAAVALFAGVTGIAALREEPATTVTATAPDLGTTFEAGAGSTPALLARALRGETVDAGPLADPGTLVGCLRGADETGTVVGALRVRFDDRPAALAVLADPQTGALTAVVVAQTCSPGDPQVLARTALD